MTLCHSKHSARFPALLALVVFATDLSAKTAPDICRDAARQAAERSGVPFDVLMAISIVETGHDGKPWPWTINVDGEGHWLESAEAAAELVEQALGEGVTNVDLGCFQLNLRWHAGSFTSAEDMLDPARNALYAANYLAGHFAKTGDWALAAAAYHSATPEHADRYRARFEEAWAGFDGWETAEVASEAERVNSFPLLVSGQTGRQGSLVPATSGGLRLIGGP